MSFTWVGTSGHETRGVVKFTGISTSNMELFILPYIKLFPLCMQNFLFKSTKEDSPLKATDFGLSDFIKPGEQKYSC